MQINKYINNKIIVFEVHCISNWEIHENSLLFSRTKLEELRIHQWGPVEFGCPCHWCSLVSGKRNCLHTTNSLQDNMCVLAYIILFLKVVIGGQQSSPEIPFSRHGVALWASVSCSVVEGAYCFCLFTQKVVVRRFQKIWFPSGWPPAEA